MKSSVTAATYRRTLVPLLLCWLLSGSYTASRSTSLSYVITVIVCTLPSASMSFPVLHNREQYTYRSLAYLVNKFQTLFGKITKDDHVLFKDIQGHQFHNQTKAGMQFPISDKYQIRSNISPSLSYHRLLVKLSFLTVGTSFFQYKSRDSQLWNLLSRNNTILLCGATETWTDRIVLTTASQSTDWIHAKNKKTSNSREMNITWVLRQCGSGQC